MKRADNQAAKGVPRFLMRGESIIASTGLAMAAILLLAIACAGGWTVFAERRTERTRVQDDLRSWGQLLARSVEQQLSNDTLSSVRTLVMDAAREHDLSECRVVLPDGQVMADAQPKGNTLKELPNPWPTGPAPSESIVRAGSRLKLTVPLTFASAANATLELATKVHYSLIAGWEAQAGIGAIGICGAVAVLVVYRRLRWKLRALGAIREALLAMDRGETAAAALAVNTAMGVEAGAWNELLREREHLRQELMTEKARESLGGKRDQRADLAQACDALWQGMVLLDESLHVKYANGAAAAFLKVKREAMGGAAIADLVKDAQVLEALKSVTGGSSRRKATFEVRRSEAEGAGILRFSVRPVRREDSASALLMIEDVTQQRVADEARNAFVAQATHELRTPLTNIRGFAEVLAMGDTGPLNERQREYLQHINASSVVLSDTIDDILDLATVDAGFMQLDLAEVPVRQAIDAAAELVAERLAEHRIALKLETKGAPRTFYGDEARLKQVLYNLLSNAANFAPPASTITLACRQVADGVEFSVHDDGPGMSEEMLGVVFSRFEARANGGRRRGTGLGLSIVKSFVELHGGTVRIETGTGKGTTVICFFPFPPDGGVREAAE